MVNERFDELSRKKDAQFLGASAYDSTLGPGVSIFTLGAAVEEGKLAQALAALEIESNRVAAARIRRRRAGSREEMVAGVVRAGVQRARQERERRLRRRVRRSLPERRTGPRHRVRIPPGAVADAVDHRCRSRRRGQGAVRRQRAARSSPSHRRRTASPSRPTRSCALHSPVPTPSPSPPGTTPAAARR